MRVLHTSDWHLGRSFLGVGMLEHQAGYVDHLLEVVDSEAVDLVVLSGDVYDRALPPADAVALFQDALERLADSRATTVVTSGNHDSHLRLGFAARLIDHAGVHLRTHAADVGTPVLLHDEHGEVAVHGIPYLEPERLREAWGLEGRSHEATLAEALRRVRADLSGRRARSVVLAHAFVAGAQPSESERDISVGGVQLVPLGLFEGLDYVALGHLHGRHTLTDRVRYSGSPLAYSFSEADHRKGSWLVDLDASGFAGATFVDAPVPRHLARLRGRLDDLLADPTLGFAEQAWVQAVLTDDVRSAGAKPRLERRFPHLLSLVFEPQSSPAVTLPRAPAGPGVSDHDIALGFVADVRGRVASSRESELLREAVEVASRDPDLEPDLHSSGVSA